jgi:hypothetical protein
MELFEVSVLDGLIHEQADGWMPELIYGQMSGWIGGWSDRSPYGRLHCSAVCLSYKYYR